jgi:hypothetical protein
MWILLEGHFGQVLAIKNYIVRKKKSLSKCYVSTKSTIRFEITVFCVIKVIS